MSIKRNTLYNIAGALTPLACTIVTVPMYLHAIGEARYGIVALVWLLFGYFGLFDLGLSTATANALARLRDGPPATRAAVLTTSVTVNLALGALVGAVILTLGWALLPRVAMDPAIRGEIAAALPWLALLCPFVTAGGAFSGVLTAHDRFLTLNLLGTAGTLLTQVVPLLAALHVGASLAVVIPATVIVRGAMVGLTAWLASRDVAVLAGRFDRERLRALLSYGGWIMITNLISPVLVSVDQFVIASLLGPSAVAHYSIAYSLAVRLLIIPTAFSQTMFPVLSRLDTDEASLLATRAVRSMTLVMTAVSVPLILAVAPFLHWWLGARVAVSAVPVAQILLVSTWINGLAFIPYALLQAQGRPNRVATFHLMEIVPFGVALIAGIHLLGLPGAALAWAFRVALDAVLLFGSTGLIARNGARLAAASGLVAGAWLLARIDWASPVYPLALAIIAGVVLTIGSVAIDPMLRRMATAAADRARSLLARS